METNPITVKFNDPMSPRAFEYRKQLTVIERADLAQVKEIAKMLLSAHYQYREVSEKLLKKEWGIE